MMFNRMSLVALFGFTATANGQNLSNLRGLQGNSGNKNKKRKMKKACTLILRVADYIDKEDEYEWDCELDPSDGPGFISFPGKKFEEGRFESGTSTLFGDVDIDERGKAAIKGNPIFGRRGGNGNGNGGNRGNGRNLLTGTRSVLAIRVVGNDITTTASEAKIAEEVFGIGGSTDVFNLRTGYSECSSGALNFEPTADDVARSITNGVYTVTLNENISGLTNSELQTKVVNQATTDLGSLSSQFDHVMLCLPPITGFGGIAYAYVNSWLSVYKDAWCNYPSAQLHEIGHNINLAHSSEGSSEYGDQSGMMGFSYSQDEGPRMCFNSAKNWQLGWFADRRATAFPLTTSWDGDLVGFVEYTNTTPDQTVILKIDGDDVDYYVGFNRKIGANSGTVEGGNQVTIHYRTPGTGYAKSFLIAKLSAGGSYVINDFAGETVTIEVQSITFSSTGGVPSVASVRVYKDSEPTQSPTKAPTKAPTKSPTKSPTKAPTEAPTKSPTESPTKSPTESPSKSPSKSPTKSPSKSPSKSPTESPSKSPSKSPTESPTKAPVTSGPTKAPTETPTKSPTKSPTESPSKAPSKSPTASPTESPTKGPTKAPVTPGPTKAPSESPTKSPTQSPTEAPTEAPTQSPTGEPAGAPTKAPTKAPVTPTASPTKAPVTPNPTKAPTAGPECSSIRWANKCKKTDGCFWRAGKCQAKSICSSFNKPKPCRRNACRWKTNTGSCIP